MSAIPQTYMHPGITTDMLALSKARRRAFVLHRDANGAAIRGAWSAADELREFARRYERVVVLLRERLANPDGYRVRGGK